MSTEAPQTAPVAPPEPQSWPALTPHERRVVGVLVEKAKTTPDAYPMTLNGLITGCNQKSNRDPVMSLVDAEVEEAIGLLKKKGLVQQITGSGRTDKFKHTLYESLKVNKVELAILTELLLRGAQTEGELRGRASRMEPIAHLEELRQHLQGLTQRGLVVYLSPPGRRGTTLTHGFHPPQELDRLRVPAEREAPAESASTTNADGAPTLSQRVATLEGELAALRSELQALRQELAAMASRERERPEDRPPPA